MRPLFTRVKKALAALVLTPLIMLTGCSSVDINEYRDTTPELNLKTFFDGKLKVYGMVQDISGKMTRRFTADIDASWDGETGVLDEVFFFDDGEEKQLPVPSFDTTGGPIPLRDARAIIKLWSL